MNLNAGFKMDFNEMEFIYGDDIFSPTLEKRNLDTVRKSLRDKNANGPDILYSIAMDIGRNEDKEDLMKQNLLYGACIYAKGRIGCEPIRSQGHIHAVSKSCLYSTPELYEILFGKAIICMQEPGQNDNGKFYAIEAAKGEKVLVPPYWAHYTINAQENEYMVFGAWCIRDFGFDYEYVRSHGGLSYYPIYNEDNTISFIHNDAYKENELIIKKTRVYREFNIDSTESLYRQYVLDKSRFSFVTDPKKYIEIWGNFKP